MTVLMANRVQGLVGGATGTYPHVAAGRLRAAGTGHAKPWKSRPAIPTIAEILPGFPNDVWYRLLAPAGTPSTTVEKFDQESMRAFADAESAKHNETIGIVPAQSTSAELREWIRPDVAGWSKVLREAGIGLNRP